MSEPSFVSTSLGNGGRKRQKVRVRLRFRRSTTFDLPCKKRYVSLLFWDTLPVMLAETLLGLGIVAIATLASELNHHGSYYEDGRCRGLLRKSRHPFLRRGGVDRLLCKCNLLAIKNDYLYILWKEETSLFDAWSKFIDKKEGTQKDPLKLSHMRDKRGM